MRERTTFSVSEFKAKSLSLFQRVSKTGASILITKRGVPIAKVVPMEQESGSPIAGKLAGMLLNEQDIISPLGADIWNATKR